MRKLQTSDIFGMCRVVSAIGVKEEIRSIALSKEKKSMEDKGYDLIFALFEKATASKAEKEFYKFFANIFEMEPKEVEKMDPVEFMDMLVEAASIDKWKAFFSRVASIMVKN